MMSLHPFDRRIYKFALLSLALHALALASWRTDLWLTGHPESILSVNLDLAPTNTSPAATPVTEFSARKKHEAGNTEGKVAPKQRVSRETEIMVAVNPTRLKSSTTDAAKKDAGNTTRDKQDSHDDGQVSQQPTPPASISAGPGDKNKSARAQIQARLITDMARYFTYPDIARRYGWEGKVLLGFNVEPDGQLRQIHVARSSGYDILDRSAVNSLGQVGRISEARSWLNGRAIDMRLSVIYRLTENY